MHHDRGKNTGGKRFRTGGSVLLGLGMLSLLVQACSGPELEPWHSETLKSEFTAKKAQANSFEEYVALEGRLFRELDHAVYGRTPTGSSSELLRYSRGSAADPAGMTPNWNRSFELEAENPRGGILLLHGMSDSPYSLRALGERLNGQGYHVLGLRLPGHGTAPSGLTSLHWHDMRAAMRLSVARIAHRVGDGPIHLVGYSTGAALAVDYALDAESDGALRDPASLVLISPALGVSPAAALARWKLVIGKLPGLGRLEWLQIDPEFDPYKYNSFATNAGDQVHRLTRRVARRMAARDKDAAPFPPTLVFKSTVDATVSTEAVVNRFLNYLSPNRHELVLFDINRAAIKSPLLVDDPGPQTRRLMEDQTLPFAVTLITNASPDSSQVESRHKPPYSSDVTATSPLERGWPIGVISLSHVALPFPPDDPLYGERPPGNTDSLFLGQLAVRGERGLLKISSDWLLRLRHNPFYDYLEDMALGWIDETSAATEQRNASGSESD